MAFLLHLLVENSSYTSKAKGKRGRRTTPGSPTAHTPGSTNQPETVSDHWHKRKHRCVFLGVDNMDILWHWSRILLFSGSSKLEPGMYVLVNSTATESIFCSFFCFSI